MRFKTDTPLNPTNGDSTMWKPYFCLLPRQVDNYIVWLEWVSSRKVYRLRHRSVNDPVVGQWEREFRLVDNQ
mgnify:CR=1 FL=1